MRAPIEGLLSTGLILAMALALQPATAAAQDVPEAPVCEVEVEPAEVPAGEAAIRITATLSEVIGPVQGLDAPEQSGLKLADPADIPRVDMANPEEEAQPIAMTPDEPNRVQVWLNTADVADLGEHPFVLTSESGECRGLLTVTGGG